MNDQPHFGGCLPRYVDQDERLARAFGVLQEAIGAHAFPGAAAAVVVGRDLVLWKGVGRLTYDPESPSVTADCIWDLASVTKVVGTTAAAMVLYERGLLDLEEPVERVLPEFTRGESDRRRARVTLRMLLAHSSGLPAYFRMYETARTPAELLAKCLSIPLEAEPGTRAEYSDIGFILLGVAIERLAGKTLDAFCKREIFERLELRDTTFNPSESRLDRIPPTENDTRFRKRIVRGEVNDENAWVLGGVAGHAGLFSTALDLARFGSCMVAGGEPLVKPETIGAFTRPEASPAGTSHALGWDTPSQPSQSGKYLSALSFGHLGFTGTSLWCDAKRQLCAVLLTNRTWPDRQSQLIKRFRPQFHDAVVECLHLT